MRRHRIRALADRRFRPCSIDSRDYLAIAPKLRAQPFTVFSPNRIWLVATGEGWLYLATILDLATRKMRIDLSLAALMTTAQRQRPAPA